MKNVFIIEDEPAIIELIVKDYTTDFQFKTFDSIYGAQASIDDRLIPDVIILDMENTNYDNHEFCHHLKLSKATKHIPIIIIKRDLESSEGIQGLKIGADYYLEKPIQKQELITALHQLTDLTPPPNKKGEKKGLIQMEMEFLIQSDEKYLKQVNDLVGSLLRKGNFEQRFLNMLRYCVLEMGKNCVEWGNRNNLKKIVKISCLLTPRVLKLKFSDQGSGFNFDPYLIEEYDPLDEIINREEEGIRRGGFGIFSIRNYMDLVTYNKLGNEVLLIKHLEENPLVGELRPQN
ncbi:ATP-binding protein [Candidatus Riflebacteria bacterium]